MADHGKNTRGRKKKIPRRNPTLSHLLTLAIVLCGGIMLYSGYRLVTTLWQYREGEKEYSNLRQYAVVNELEETEEAGDDTSLTPVPDETALSGDPAADEAEKKEESAEKEQEEESKEEKEEKEEPETPVEKPEETERDFRTTEKPPVTVDFESLKAINEDVVGWLYIGSLDLSYPIVQGEDDDYYLHRTFEQTYNFSGSIFVEYLNSSDFSDPNTIIYGHNMQNGSMFGYLLRLTAEDLYKKDPYFWILTPDGNYKYAMFSIHETAISSEVYSIFGGRGTNFVDWAKNMQKISEADLKEQSFALDSRVVTLSTCTNDSTARYVVQGVALADEKTGQSKKAKAEAK